MEYSILFCRLYEDVEPVGSSIDSYHALRQYKAIE